MSILDNNNTLWKGGVETLEVEDNNKEEDLVEVEAKSCVILWEAKKFFLILSKSYEKLYIL